MSAPVEPQSVLFAEAQNVLYNKKVYFALMLRNGFHMPKITSSICSLEWMDKVREGSLWIPKDEDVWIKNCAAAPTKINVLLEIEKLLKLKNLGSIGWTDELKPDKQWCLTVLSTLSPQHPFFSKTYQPVQAKMRKKIEDKNNFFQNIPF